MLCVRVVVMFYWAENYFVPLVSSRRKQMPESFINTQIHKIVSAIDRVMRNNTSKRKTLKIEKYIE